MKEFTIFGRSFQFLTNDSQWVKLQNFLNLYLFDNTWGQYALLILLAVLAGFLLSLVLRGGAKKAVNLFTFLLYCGAMILLFIVVREPARGLRVFNISDYLTDTGFHETRVLIGVINGLLFVPFGILLRKASGRGHGISNVFLTMLMAVGIEMAQYVFSRGYTALEDVAVYLIGGFAGMILAAPFCLISESAENRRRRRKTERNRRRQNRYRYHTYGEY